MFGWLFVGIYNSHPQEAVERMASDVLAALSLPDAAALARPQIDASDPIQAWFDLVIGEARTAARRFRSEMMRKDVALDTALDAARLEGAQHEAQLAVAEGRLAELAAEEEELRSLLEKAGEGRRAAEQRISQLAADAVAVRDAADARVAAAERRVAELEHEQRTSSNAPASLAAAELRLQHAERQLAVLESELQQCQASAISRELGRIAELEPENRAVSDTSLQQLQQAARRIAELESELHQCQASAMTRELASEKERLALQRQLFDARASQRVATEHRAAKLEPEQRSPSDSSASLAVAERRLQTAERRIAELESELHQCQASAMTRELASEKERLALQRQLFDARASKEAADIRLQELEKDAADFTQTMDTTLQRLCWFPDEVGSFPEQRRGSLASSPSLLRMSQLRVRAEFLGSEMLLSRVRQLQQERDHLARRVTEQSSVRLS